MALGLMKGSATMAHSTSTRTQRSSVAACRPRPVAAPVVSRRARQVVPQAVYGPSLYRRGPAYYGRGPSFGISPFMLQPALIGFGLLARMLASAWANRSPSSWHPKGAATHDKSVGDSTFQAADARVHGRPHIATSTTHPVELKTREQAYELQADCPGVAEEDLTIEVTPDNILTVAGVRQKEGANAPAAGEAHSSPAVAYRFSRTVSLPEDAEVDGIVAALDKGVLTVTIPRKLTDKPKPRRVTVTARS